MYPNKILDVLNTVYMKQVLLIVLAALGLDADFQLVAVDKEGKEKFWEHNLQRRARATRKMTIGGTDDGRE